VERPANTTRVWRFGLFEVDAADGELRRGGKPVKMREQSFRILVFLLEHSGEIVTRESLRGVLWPSDTFVDFDHSLNTAVMKLRDALGDSADTPLYIETLPKRGYRFIAPMTVVERETPSISPVPSSGPASAPLWPGEGNAGAARTEDGFRATALEYSGADAEVATLAEGLSNAESGYSASPALARYPPSSATKMTEPPLAYRKVWRILVPAAVFIAVTIAGAFYYRSRQATHRLTEKDIIVLADFGNSTGDAIFDDTLKTALNISLQQSPFLNVLSDSEVTRTLQLMSRPAGTKLTPEVARELCQRAGSKAYIGER
jgi:eukaryotic-like serine/threonine-protein kinase